MASQLRSGVLYNPISSGTQSESRRGSKKFRNVIATADKHLRHGGHGSDMVATQSDDENAVIRFLLSERVFGYPSTDGSLTSNYKCFVFNNHPLLSICLQHPLHPCNMKRRIAIFISTVAVAVTLSYVVWETDFVPWVRPNFNITTTANTP